DVAADPNFPRAGVANKEGLRAAFGFPILLGSDVLAVLEYFTDEVREPDRDLLRSLAAIGGHVGQFLERQRAERDLRESEDRKGAILETALDCIVTIDHEGTIVEFNPAAEST